MPENKQTSTETNQQEVAQTPAENEEEQKQPKEKKAAAKKKKENEFETKFNQLNDTYLRMLAEYDNYRKRTQKEKDGMFFDGISKVVLAILPVLDNFERALMSPSNDEEFRNGIDMIYKQMLTSLDSLGIKELECKGQKFDPKKHNAIMHIEDEQYGEDEIVEVFQKGYIYKDETIIRHAVVKVAN